MFIGKKITIVALVLVVVSSAFAGDPIEKLGRGIANVAFSPLELIHKPVDVAQEKGNVAGLTAGVLYGAVFTIARIGVGVADICTFLIPLPGCKDSPYEDGWGYGPMAFKKTPWVADTRHDSYDFFYNQDSLVDSDF